MPGKRKYELRKRAEQVEETRRRITEVTVELHRTVGPAATGVSEIARRAGVQRVTVYNHFPDEKALFAACSAHWSARHPAPDPDAWRAVSDAGERLRFGLCQLYQWYRETEPMTANVLRDAEALPALRVLLDEGLGRYLEGVRQTLVQPVRVPRGRRARVDAALRAVTDFHVWRLLAPLGDAEAADLGAGLVEQAAAGRPGCPSEVAEPGVGQPETPVPIGQATPVPPMPQ